MLLPFFMTGWSFGAYVWLSWRKFSRSKEKQSWISLLYESLQPAEVSEIVIMAAIKVNFGQTVNFWSILLPLNNFFCRTCYSIDKWHLLASFLPKYVFDWSHVVIIDQVVCLIFMINPFSLFLCTFIICYLVLSNK